MQEDAITLPMLFTPHPTPNTLLRTSPPHTRTMYSAGATYSTLPLLSSGRSSASRRRPEASVAQKDSTGTSFTLWHTLQE